MENILGGDVLKSRRGSSNHDREDQINSEDDTKKRESVKVSDEPNEEKRGIYKTDLPVI